MAGGRLLRRRLPHGGARRAVVREDQRRLFRHPRDAAFAPSRRAARAQVDSRMIRIALTGSIGMGKSTVARMFEAAGVPVFDSDAEVRRLQADGSPMTEQIGALFPGAVRDGLLDREKL